MMQFRTPHMMTAAVLMSKGGELMDAVSEGGNGNVVFELEISPELKTQLLEIRERCSDKGHGLQVDLGKWWTAYNCLKDAIKRVQGVPHERRGVGAR